MTEASRVTDVKPLRRRASMQEKCARSFLAEDATDDAA
jgi:hypothetical protein